MKLAVLMDPLTKIKVQKDSTIAMLKASLQLGWETFFFTAADMSCREGEVSALVTKILAVQPEKENWITLGNQEQISLNEFDFILMRKDPPFDMEYIYATYALELAERSGVLIANKPQSLRDANEKFYTLHFPQCCPLTFVSKNISLLKDFWREQGKVVFKPLSGMGGDAIFYVDERGDNLSVILEVLTKNETVSIMAQRYIPEIKTAGDKRVLVIYGEPVPYALARIPQAGELRGNLAAGARGEVVPITDRDRWICKQLASEFIQKGLYFVGIDIIGDYLTEINVTSPTCVREIETVTGLDIAESYLKKLADIDTAR